MDCLDLEARVLSSGLKNFFTESSEKGLIDASIVAEVVIKRNIMLSSDQEKKEEMNEEVNLIRKFRDYYFELERFPSRKKQSQTTLHEYIEQVVKIISSILSDINITNVIVGKPYNPKGFKVPEFALVKKKH